MAGSVFRSGACAVLTAILLVGIAPAQDAGTPAPAEQAEARKDRLTVLDAISVTATRNPIRSFDYPGMVSVVGRERDSHPATVDAPTT